MADEEDRNEFIQLNFCDLVDHTVLSVDLINRLFQERLITRSELSQINGMTDMSMKATHLYTNIACKWDDSQFDKFLDCLKTTGNLMVHEMFTDELTKSQINFLKEEMIKANFHKSGAYEGINKEAEDAGNNLMKDFVSGALFTGEKFLSDKSVEDMKKIVPIIKKFISAVECGTVWFNNWKPVLPENYIDRKVTKTEDMDDLTLGYNNPRTSLFELTLKTKDKLILLVDGPGMGKSSALTNLELDLRSYTDIHQRIIIRINLNQFCGILQQRSSNQFTLVLFMTQIAKYVPLVSIEKLNVSQVPVYLLLDGLDEVLPMYKDAMIDILRGLLNNVNPVGTLCVAKVVVTTRVHIRELIEKEFGVQSVSLCSLEYTEQINYLLRELKTLSRYDIQKNLKSLPARVVTLLSNPLMLNMYSQIIRDNTSMDFADLYALYSGFIDRKHELYLTEKEKVDPALPSSIRRKHNFLANILTVYNYIAVKEHLYMTGIEFLLSFPEGQAFLKKPKGELVDEILSYGLVVIESSKLRFKHRSFAEFFYARMMTEATDMEFKNALFSTGYNELSLVSKFLKCKFPGESITSLVSVGWTKFAKNNKLVEFKDENNILFDHILSKTIEYDKECPLKKLLVRDLYDNNLLFVHWLNERPEEKRDWIRSIFFNESMSEVLAFIVFSREKDLEDFVQKWLVGSGGEELIRNSLTHCQDAIQIAVKWKHKELDPPYYTDNLLERMRRWLTLEEVKECARKGFGSDEDFERFIVTNREMSKLYASLFSRDELFELVCDEGTRVTDLCGEKIKRVRTCWGEQFCPEELLKFRFKFGEHKGKSLFVNYISDHLKNKVLQETKANVHEAAQVILDDGDFGLIYNLKRNFIWLEAISDVRLISYNSNIQNDFQSTQGIQSSSKLDTTSSCWRWKLTRDILTKVDWSLFDAKAIKWGVNYYNFVGYAMLDSKETWEEIFEERKLELEKLDWKYFDTIFYCLVQAAINEEEKVRNGRVHAPFESVRSFLKNSTLHCFASDCDVTPLLDIITGLGREAFINFAMITSEDSSKVLVKVPSVWEVLFLPGGLAHSNQTVLNEVITTDGWNDILSSIIWEFMYTSPFSYISILQGVRQILETGHGQVRFKQVIKSKYLPSDCHYIAHLMWRNNVDVAKSFIAGVLGMYVDVFGDEWEEWLDELVETIPVEVAVVGEENGWTELVSRVKEWVIEESPDWFSLKTNITTKDYHFKYNRSCDWYRLILFHPGMSNRVPADYANQTEVFLNWECCFLRVWIRVFGHEKTREFADKEFSESKSFVTKSFWEAVAEDMRDGELLHIAVQVGSLLGVMATAWPGMLTWRDKKNGNKTALEFSTEKWGGEHEISKYLLKEYQDLTSSGFLQL